MSGIGVISYYAMKDPGSGVRSELGAPVGLVSKTGDILRLKHKGDFFWTDSKLQFPVYDQTDVLLVGKEPAEITLSNKKVIKLFPGTSLKIFDENSEGIQRASLSLLEGEFEIRSPADLIETKVKVQDGFARILGEEPYSVLLRRTDKGLALGVLDGVIRIPGLEGNTRFSQGVAGTILESQDGEKGFTFTFESTPVSLRLLYPQENHVFGDKTEVSEFRWQIRGSLTDLSLEVSATQDFSKIEFSDSIIGKDSTYVPLHNLKGQNYWRIRGYAEGGVPVYSRVASFSRDASRSIQLNVSRTFVEPGKWQLSVTPEPVENFKYEFQLAQDELFKNLYDAYAGYPPFRINMDQDGLFYLRARKIYEDGSNSDWLSKRALKVEKRAPEPRISLKDAGVSPEGAAQAVLIIQPYEGVKSFKVFSSASATFEGQREMETTSLEVTVKNVTFSNQYFRVQANLESGEYTDSSNIVTLGPSKTMLERYARVKKESLQNISLITPTERDAIFKGESQYLFKWKGVVASEVHIATQDTFADARVYPIKEGEQSQIALPATAGVYYWRVKNKFGISPSTKFSILEPGDVQIEKIKVDYISAKSWHLFPSIKGLIKGAEAKLEIAKDMQFKDAKVIQIKPQEHFTVETPGTYFVRARSYKDRDLSRWSRPFKVDVKMPVLVPFITLKSQTPHMNKEARIHLEWEKVLNATRYKLELSPNPDFTDVTLTRTTETPEVIFTHSSQEPQYARVTALAGDGGQGAISNLLKIKGLLLPPVMEVSEVAYAPVGSGAVDSMRLLWAHRNRAKRYKLEIGRKSDLSDAKTYTVETIEYMQALKEKGMYYYRIRSLSDTPNDYYEAPSGIYGVNYEELKPLSKPKLAGNRELVISAESVKEGVSLSWETVPYAAYYEIEIARNAKYEDSVSIRVDDRQYRAKNIFSKGVWYWRVRAKTDYNNSEWSENQKIDVRDNLATR